MSVSGVGKSAIELMNLGVSLAFPLKNCIAVKLNAVADITLTPFSKMSAVVPFHLIATFEVFADVVCKVVDAPAKIFTIVTRVDAADDVLNVKPLPLVAEFNSFKNIPTLDTSLVNGMLFLKSTNQVPPLAVISPLVKMLPLLITSAFLVTDADVVGM